MAPQQGSHSTTEAPDGSQPLPGIRELLAALREDPASTLPGNVQKAIQVARALQNRANHLQTPQERRQQSELDRMIHHPQDKATLTQLTDQAFRAKTPHRAVDQLTHILDVQGIPRFFSPLDRTLLRGFQSFGGYLPGVAVPLVKEKMQRETANVILPAEREMLAQHLNARREEGLRMNVNLLGEALLGEEAARNRLRLYLQTLQLPEIEVISVKISTIYSQIWPLAREHAINTICERVELLYRAASKATYVRADGSRVPKFVYLDMEEYRDMGITAEAFMRTLDRPALKTTHAGIVLQAYIPDAFRVQQQINRWARRRVADEGAPITLRIVKGANMEMERVEASLRDWPQAPYRTKLETDANYKRMLQEGMRPENLQAVRLGIASHNLFELAYALVLAVENDGLDCVQFEMLEGMANHQRRALFELAPSLLLYAPACKKSDFIHAIGYLIRRLDENTGPDNFLRHAFRLQVGQDDWNCLEQAFIASFSRLDGLSDAPRRTQDRSRESEPSAPEMPAWDRFYNEPDTDFSLIQNYDWSRSIMDTWKSRCDGDAIQVPLVIDGLESHDAQGRRPRESWDPSRPGVVAARYLMANDQDVERAVHCARRDDDGWRRLTPEQRRAVMREAAKHLRSQRGDLLGAALLDGGKTLAESDPEVSEAIDFVEFYSLAAEFFSGLRTVRGSGKGVVVVVSPWNFPIAIPCGGVAAALAAGNTVILKPASDTVLPAYLLCQCFWRAGVSQKTLQFVPCSGAEQGAVLVAHPQVDAVILTGGTETALQMLSNKPSLHLLAETGGKNATIVTALSDRDQAIKHVLHSAFGHSGQKCSATSLLILEQEVYDDESFKKTLCDAVASLEVGSAGDAKNRLGPMIRPPAGELEAALKELEPGESWAVMPRQLENNPCLYSPAVKWGVQPGSKTHLTEFFGPVLGVMKAHNLMEAIELVNQTGYGLTSGLESLDEREQDLWRNRIRAGNLYINRPTTGAIVLRQPFGGMGKSAFGPGIKAGGPNYVAQLMNFHDVESVAREEEIENPYLDDLRVQLSCLLDAHEPDLEANEIRRTIAAIASYDRNMREEFGVEHDHFRLVGQDNVRRYLPVPLLHLRVHPDDTWFEVFARACAAKAVGCGITVSLPTGPAHPAAQRLEQFTESWAGGIEFLEESEERLAERVAAGQTDRVRYAGPGKVPPLVYQALAARGGQADPAPPVYLAQAPVLAEGRIELLWYVQEQSICHDYHRYGYLGARLDEPRAEVE